ncbi:MAG: DUF2497 domain-containing protein [Pseudomonadota bacterium]
MAKDTDAQQDPSIEEILASIRQIISDDETAPETTSAPENVLDADANANDDADAAAHDAVLDLTEDMQADTTFADALNAINDDETPAESGAMQDYDVSFRDDDTAAPATAAAVGGTADDIDAFLADMKKQEGHAMTNSVEEAADPSSALFDATAANATRDAFVRLTENVALSRRPVDDGALTLEDVVKDLLRPMLRQWINENVPAIVEALVEKELDKLSRRAVAE